MTEDERVRGVIAADATGQEVAEDEGRVDAYAN
jgi:hypothetical protein